MGINFTAQAFNSGFREIGQAITVLNDLERLTDCLKDQPGVENWAINYQALSPPPILAFSDSTPAPFLLSLLVQKALIVGSQWQFRRYLNRLDRSESQYHATTLTPAK